MIKNISLLAALAVSSNIAFSKESAGQKLVQGTLNVIVILWDDVGFAQFGCYGAPLATPNVDRLAANGLRYTNFHVAPVCSPSRAALLTGRNPHSVGVGQIGEHANGQKNNLGGPHLDAGTIANYLRAAGYSTFAIGKWHLTPLNELNSAASSDYWPTGRGFDHFYGYMGGDTNQFAPEIFHGRERVQTIINQDDKSYFLDADLTDHAISYIAQNRASGPEKPFFLYLSYCAGHAPHQAPGEYLSKWRGRFDEGWDKIRAATLARQKQLGLIPVDLEVRSNPGVSLWTDLTEEQRRIYARYYEAFAACMEYTDAQLGRLLDYLEHAGLTNNTLILLASDNGASAEGGKDGIWNEIQLFTQGKPGNFTESVMHFDDIGGLHSYPTYPTGWTQAGNTPFRLTKGTLYEGGIRTPLIASWPARITDINGIRTQFHDVVDILPTIMEAVDVIPLSMVDGRIQLPLAGTSLAYTWDNASMPSNRETQYFEFRGHRAIYDHGWKAVTFHKAGVPYEQDVWELYDLSHDPNELHDLGATHPEKLSELLTIWEREARRNDVYPLSDRKRDVHRPPENLKRTHVTYLSPVSGLHKFTALENRDRSVAEIPKKRFSVPGPMVVTEFSSNSFPYELQKRIEEEVNKIIDQEIDRALKRFNKMDLVKDFARFRPKERLWITLYYLGNMDERNDNVLVDALTDMQKHNQGIKSLPLVKISNCFDFFGSIKELVVKIDDEKQGLTLLRAGIKNTFLNANEAYKKVHEKQLYDPSFSEQHRYEPHITFGHISSTIQHFLEKNSISSKDVMDRIFDRIKTELPGLLKLIDSQRTLKIDMFQFNDSNRAIVKKFKLLDEPQKARGACLAMSAGKLPPQTGKRSIGTTLCHVIDESRKEPHS